MSPPGGGSWEGVEACLGPFFARLASDDSFLAPTEVGGADDWAAVGGGGGGGAEGGPGLLAEEGPPPPPGAQHTLAAFWRGAGAKAARGRKAAPTAKGGKARPMTRAPAGGGGKARPMTRAPAGGGGGGG